IPLRGSPVVRQRGAMRLSKRAELSPFAVRRPSHRPPGDGLAPPAPGGKRPEPCLPALDGPVAARALSGTRPQGGASRLEAGRAESRGPNPPILLAPRAPSWALSARLPLCIRYGETLVPIGSAAWADCQVADEFELSLHRSFERYRRQPAA